MYISVENYKEQEIYRTKTSNTKIQAYNVGKIDYNRQGICGEKEVH